MKCHFHICWLIIPKLLLGIVVLEWSPEQMAELGKSENQLSRAVASTWIDECCWQQIGLLSNGAMVVLHLKGINTSEGSNQRKHHLTQLM